MSLELCYSHSRARFQGSQCPSVQDSSRWRLLQRTHQEIQEKLLDKNLRPLLLLSLLQFQMLPPLHHTGPQMPRSPR